MTPAAPSAHVRGTAVGALTAALSIAAHSVGGGGLPSSTDLSLLLIAACVVGAVVAETSWLTRGRLPLLAALLGGQGVGHFILAASSSGHGLDHSAAVGWQMILTHLAAAVVCAALIELIERLYGPLTTMIRAATSPRAPGPVTDLWRVAPRPSTPSARGDSVALDSLSRRGPPVWA